MKAGSFGGASNNIGFRPAVGLEFYRCNLITSERMTALAVILCVVDLLFIYGPFPVFAALILMSQLPVPIKGKS